MAAPPQDGKMIWMDGKMTPYQDARIHVLSHSIQYGTAIFEGIRAYDAGNGKTSIFRAKEHYLRFIDSMTVLGYQSPYSVEQYVDATCQLIRENELPACYIRPYAYVDDKFKGLTLPDDAPLHVAIATWGWGKYMGDEGAKKGVRALVSTYQRDDVASSLPWAKISGGYLKSVLARREGAKNGAEECILLDPNGFVAEGCGDNLFMVKNNRIFTPEPNYILPGLTRDAVMKIARSLGYEVSETSITRNQLYLADEVFFTGTAVEITPVREVDNRQIGDGNPGVVTRKISETFFKCTRGEVAAFGDWNCFVS